MSPPAPVNTISLCLQGDINFLEIVFFGAADDNHFWKHTAIHLFIGY